ncbi:MAG TPA: hypothetical protein PLS69_04720 [Terricaulis sp.]|nr:hypothetical protein [Terricaulis sp.]HRP11205.1 hypothetical protein [Terricaulis sp.]
MEIYSNPRGWRVRIAQAAIWLFGGLIVWLAFFSNGRVDSFGEQIFVWVAGALAALIMAATEYYLRAYVIEMRLEGGLRITTLSFFGQRSFTIDPADARVGGERHDFFVGRSIVNNFWMPMNVPGEPLPLIVDTTAAGLDMAALDRAARRRK